MRYRDNKSYVDGNNRRRARIGKTIGWDEVCLVEKKLRGSNM